ncbi:cytosolic phospholipase A2 gamma-like [Sinocyclocheilus grahami]|uniref:cytosolic phospholipase A2 gamma-like n=1 Tax=Sinocyclocheilus grahami TaxID=75366 RepID=UPI0007AC9975|nr:PREDICTED: cytosolic phospholipase A2 gamma-like [Sinocyclocheilus grahami]
MTKMMSASKPQESSEVRFGHSLNKEEEEFVARRKNTVLQCLQKLNIHCSQDKVPNIALLGSGGGQRAMVGLLECLVQLDKAGLLDCILYLSGVSGSTWYEPCHEAGYSLSGAFVETCNFGSQFDNGSKKKHQPEIDMLYLQAMCSSALADGEATWKWIKAISVPEIKSVFDKMEQDQSGGNASRTTQEPVGEDECYQELLNPVDAETLTLEQSSRTKLTDFSGGQRQLIHQLEKLNDDKAAGKKAAKQYVMQYTVDVCNYFELKLNFWPFGRSICKCIAQWIWGRHYNFLHNMTDDAVPAALLESETRDYIDAGLLLNSPYFSVLREERDIDLIISLDFSERDPFMTVLQTAETCRKQNIPFPEVNIPSEDLKKPKDFYVFKGQNAPTVIHIPLFNVVNCGGKPGDWRKKYGILKGPYSAEMITEVMGVAGKNISNNREKLLEQIRAVAEAK